MLDTARRYNARMRAALLLAALMCLCLMGSLPVQSQSASPNKSAQGTKSQAESKLPTAPGKDGSSFEGWQMASTITSAAATLLIAIFAIVQVAVMYKQRLTMEAQLKVMHGQLKQMQDGMRPWIGIGKGDISSGPVIIDAEGAISIWPVTTTITNFGNYPGSVSNVVAHVIVADIGHGSELVSERLKQHMKAGLPRGPGPSITLFPGGRQTFTNSTFVTRSDISQKSGGMLTQLSAYLVGGFAYEDPLGNVHRTAFSYSYQVPSGVPQLVVFGLTLETVIPAGVWVEHRTITA